MRWILVGVTAALMVFCIYYMIKHKSNRFVVISLSLIVSGGLGNIIDRIFRNGLVVDYLDVKLFKFAIFNFADSVQYADSRKWPEAEQRHTLDIVVWH